MHDIENFQTPRLILRRPTSVDTKAYFEIYGDAATNVFNPAGPCASYAEAESAMAQQHAKWERYGHGLWAISLQSRPDEVIGFGGLTRRIFGEAERVNLGFRFGTSAWGKGYATELAQACLDVAWHHLLVPEVWASVRENHQVSRRVLEKIGMKPVERVPDFHGMPASIWYLVSDSSEGR